MRTKYEEDKAGAEDVLPLFPTRSAALSFGVLRKRTYAAKCVAEFFATLMFVFVSCAAAVANPPVSVGDNKIFIFLMALTNGMAIFVLAMAMENVSGGHMNPVVSFVAVLLRKMSPLTFVTYLVSQLLGAASGAALLKAVYPAKALEAVHYGAHVLGPDVAVGTGIIMETALTTILVLTILRVGFDSQNMGYLAPLAIGFAVMIDCVIGISVTGASMNPARSFGPALVANHWSNHEVYWVGPFCGALLAAVIYVVFLQTHLRRDHLPSSDARTTPLQ